MNPWVFEKNSYCEATHLYDAPVNTLGNGLVGCRGFFEEQQQGIAGLGGIYMSGVYGAGDYRPYVGDPRELVNVPNFFWTQIYIDGKPLSLHEENIGDFSTQLNLQTATLTRSYTYYENDQPLLRLAFLRFISRDKVYGAGQQISVTPLQSGLTVTVDCGINAQVTNLNLKSTDPVPVQPGRRQYRTVLQNAHATVIKITKPEPILLAFAQKTMCDSLSGKTNDISIRYTIQTEAQQETVIQKLVTISLSIQDGEDVETTAYARLERLESFEKELALHSAEMLRRWQEVDIQLEGSEEDQLALRYNLFQLMQACPEHSNRRSIGARGLTGEMYEGCIFWDTEAFMLPFFTMTNPAAARGLLMYRYHTLAQAKKHAKSHGLNGAMYGWQVNDYGQEQTPPGGGAFYSIHVIADIAYAVQQYWLATEDGEFMMSYGLELLIETTRFWASRATRREDGKYDIMAVRGPNEYDIMVNNNLYTNMMARENILLCIDMLRKMKILYEQKTQTLENKMELTKQEQLMWSEVACRLVLPYDSEMDLWLEDDTYLRRRPLDLSKAKTDGQHIVNSSVPYETLPLYQVTKQADVLHLMKNLPNYFTPKQMQTAYDFYEPKTAFDSSLCYSVFSLMAARLGREDAAVSYYDQMANLDIRNVQLNTISGLHFANFGGTWQTVVFGFGGVTVESDGIRIKPHLPNKWSRISFRLKYRNAVLKIEITHNQTTVTLLQSAEQPVSIFHDAQHLRLNLSGDRVSFS